MRLAALEVWDVQVGTVPALADQNGNGRADPGEAGYASLSYQLVVGSGATPKSYLNTAVAKDVCPSCAISNSDQARVTVVLDPLFDLGTIIGKVFLDKNENGYQDPDEDQIPPNFKYVKGSARLNGQPAADPAGNRTLVYARQGEGAPPKVLSWDGTKSDDSFVEGGRVCQYQLAVSYADGSSSSTPRRSFGVNVSSAISLNLMGGAFRTGSDQLTARARPILLETALVLKRFTRERILIEGHTDGIGSEAYNLDLSRRRAEAALNYFVQVEKIPRERFTLSWYGKSRPIATNALEEGRELNRRVVIKGEFSDRLGAKVTEEFRGTPEAKVNGAALALDPHGRFATQVADEKRSTLEVELSGSQGGACTPCCRYPTWRSWRRRAS